MSEWQKVVTGTDDQGNETYDYAFGAEVDGVFVPAITKSSSYVEQIVETGKQQQTDGGEQTPSATDGGEQTGAEA